jgi:hypothetical protein
VPRRRSSVERNAQQFAGAPRIRTCRIAACRWAMICSSLSMALTLVEWLAGSICYVLVLGKLELALWMLLEGLELLLCKGWFIVIVKLIKM